MEGKSKNSLDKKLNQKTKQTKTKVKNNDLSLIMF